MATANCMNPFFHRGPVRDPAYFFARQREIETLLNLIRNAQCVSVYGQRRVGKSSFVLHVTHPSILQSNGLQPEHFCLAYVDCQGRNDTTIDEFCELLCASVAAEMRGRKPWTEPPPAARWSQFQRLEHLLGAVSEAGYRPVLILDEFEAIANGRYLTHAFFSSLRRIATGTSIPIVTVTRGPLSILCAAQSSFLDSPFFNIFHPLSLGLFTRAEAEETLAGLAALAGARFTRRTSDFLLDLAGGHPLMLQLAGFHAFELLGPRAEDLGADELALLRERFWTTAVQHFAYYWSHLDEQARYVLATLPVASVSHGGVLEQLLKDCLIVRRGAGYDYFCSSFRDYVYQCELPGLIYCGPFLVDPRNRTLLVAGQPVELTKIEFDLFLYLLQHEGEAASYAEIEQHVWGDAFSGDPERLKAAIKHLRQALGEYGACVANMRSIGYRLQF